MKTEKQFYVSGLNCDEQPDAAQKQFEITKRRFKKEGGIVCFHGYQSFAPGGVTPEIAHAIGIEAVAILLQNTTKRDCVDFFNTVPFHFGFGSASRAFMPFVGFYGFVFRLVN